MRAPIALVSLLSLSTCGPREPVVITPPEPFVLAWSEDFDGLAGASPDPSRWVLETGTGPNGDGWGNNELQTYTGRPENVSLDGQGNLLITARREDLGGRQYTSARITTQGLFAPQYGRIEARIKVPAGKGLWPAFWLLGSNITTVPWPGCGEIDVLELRGNEPGVVLGSLHGPEYFGGGAISKKYTLRGATFDQDFHLFAVQWDPGQITFWVDDQLFQTVTANTLLGSGRTWVFDGPFFIILNLAVGGTFLGPGGPARQHHAVPQRAHRRLGARLPAGPGAMRCPWLTVLLAASLAGCTCRDERRRAPPGVLTLTAVEQQATWIRNFNPLMPGSRWPSAAGIYEPLAVFNSVQGEWVPWLATGWAWRDEGLSLVFTMREGVQWSDGTPFTADDVLFTFELIHRFPALDQQSVWKFLESVSGGERAGGAFPLPARLRPRTAGAGAPADRAPARVGERGRPGHLHQPRPGGHRAPSREVRLFQNQVYELAKNPHYWQPGKPAVEAIRLPAFPGNDQANIALVDGELDWAANYVPAVERVFVRRDPAHHHYWYPPTGTTVFLYANTTQAPFDEVKVRKALSMAIDRELVVDVAMSHYTSPADATGLSGSYDKWRDAAAVKQGDWVRFDAAQAERMLDEAGLTRGRDGVRTLPGGGKLKLSIAVVNGWSDWVRAAQIISRGCFIPMLGVGWLDTPARGALFLLIVCAYWAVQLMAAPAWVSLMGDLVPEAERGAYFARRSRALQLATFISMVGAGAALSSFKERGQTLFGFAVIFGVACVARLGSMAFLWRHHDPAVSTPPNRHDWKALLEPLRLLRQRQLIRYLTTMNFAVYLSAPFFAAYMLRLPERHGLAWSYGTFTLVTAVAVVSKYLFLPLWGRAADRYGSRKCLVLSGWLVCGLPLPWLFPSTDGAMFLAVIIASQVWSGFAWAGHELCSFNFQLDSAPPEERTRLVSSMNAVNGVMLFGGALIGAVLVESLPSTLNPFLVVFAVSSGLRLLTCAVLLPHLKEMRVVEHISYRSLFFRVVAIRPQLGPMLRFFALGTPRDGADD